jgi:hypothetical protein
MENSPKMPNHSKTRQFRPGAGPSIKFWLLSVLTLICAGCTESVLHGIVRNIEGETLPGVSIRVSGSDAHAVSNARGEYALAVQPGQHTATYAKSGYTLSRLEFSKTLDDTGPIPDVKLWNLPPQNSVFLYSDTIYTPTTWVIPKQFYMSDGTIDYGTQRIAEAITDSAAPAILFYRTPRYDARLTRLQEKEAQLPQDDKQTFNIWAAGGTMGIDLKPVDPADPTLMKLELLDPLEPGVYAIHWGALDGYTVIDERIYIFEVIPPKIPDFEEVVPQFVDPTATPNVVEDDAP